MLTIALPTRYAGLADDTEESLLGSSLHQQAIVALNTGLTLCGPRHVATQCIAMETRRTA